MSRREDSKARDDTVTVNVEDFTRTRDSVSYLFLFLMYRLFPSFCPPARARGLPTASLP